MKTLILLLLSSSFLQAASLRTQTEFPVNPPKYTIALIGTSLTDPRSSLAVQGYESAAFQLETNLLSLGYSAKVRCFSKQGNHTGLGGTHQLTRMWEMNRIETPRVAVLEGGANDVPRTIGAGNLVSSGTTATVTYTAHGLSTNELVKIVGADQAGYNTVAIVLTVADANTFTYTMSASGASPATGTITWEIPTQTNLQAQCMYLLHGCKGAVNLETQLPSTEPQGTKYVVVQDSGANGGVNAPTGSGQVASIAGSLTKAITVWQCRYIGGIGTNYWGRIANTSTAGSATTNIVILGQQYLNYSSGGDNAGTSTVYAPYDNITGTRSKQIAAAAAMVSANPNVVYANLYGVELSNLTAGIAVQGDFREHAADGNQHPSAYGNNMYRMAVFNSLNTIGFTTLFP